MNYLASITDFFKSPKWGMNLLLGAVCFLIPFVGPLVLHGWHITALWSRRNADPAWYPEFNFEHFAKYLERGLWPFLVALVVSLVLIPIVMIAFFLGMGAFVALVANVPDQEASGAISFFGMIAMIGLWTAIIMAMHLVSLPLTLCATITQDFGRSFNFGFMRQFVGKVWMEMILSALFMFVAGAVLMVGGMLACVIGVYATVPVALFAWHHLEKQLYELYLSRGGEPIPPAPGLFDTPPPFPPALVPPKPLG